MSANSMKRKLSESKCWLFHVLIIQTFYSNNEAEATKKMFRQIQEHVQIMVELFKRSKFFLSVASKMSYDDGIVFTENNIVAYLAELEEHICSLVTYSAFKKDDPNAAISAIPLS